jgi:aerobic-type carbon monoxide dehydrogenase small subunit (CoxS/CutS family)
VTARSIVRDGVVRRVEAEDDATLLDVVQDVFEAHATTKGCVDGQCGTCRVLLDGQIVASCKTKWGSVRDGADLATYEDVQSDPAVVRAVGAFEHERPTRCFQCVGGLGVTAFALLGKGRKSGEDAVDRALESATCMCTGRGSLRRALLAAMVAATAVLVSLSGLDCEQDAIDDAPAFDAGVVPALCSGNEYFVVPASACSYPICPGKVAYAICQAPYYSGCSCTLPCGFAPQCPTGQDGLSELCDAGETDAVAVPDGACLNESGPLDAGIDVLFPFDTGPDSPHE